MTKDQPIPTRGLRKLKKEYDQKYRHYGSRNLTMTKKYSNNYIFRTVT